MKNLCIAAALLCLTAICTSAQRPEEGDRGRYMAEMRNLKHDFLSRELKLTAQQQQEFFPIYDKMEDEIFSINAETRKIEKETLDNADATATELEAAARATFEQKEREAKVELEAYDQFKTILEPRQLLSLKNAERKFTQQLIRKHRNSRPDNAKARSEKPEK